MNYMLKITNGVFLLMDPVKSQQETGLQAAPQGRLPSAKGQEAAISLQK